MEEILDAIHEALQRKGLSEAAASRLASGNPSAIKNLRRKHGTTRSHPIENLLKVAKVLDLEVYVGPRRGDVTGFSSGGQVAFQAAAKNLDVLIPFHEETGQGILAPFAISSAWVATYGLDRSNLAAVRVLSSSPSLDLREGDVAIIDTTAPFKLDGRVFAYFPTALAAVEFGQLLQHGSGPITAVAGDPPLAYHMQARSKLRLLGALVAVWSSRSAKGDPA